LLTVSARTDRWTAQMVEGFRVVVADGPPDEDDLAATGRVIDPFSARHEHP